MQQRRAIALLMNSEGLRDDYQGGLRRGVETACIERDIDLWVFAIRTDAFLRGHTDERFLELISPSNVHGVIIAASCVSTALAARQLVSTIQRQGIAPICVIGQNFGGISSILVDNERGTRKIIEHLVEVHGRRHFLYLGGPEGHEEADARARGFVASLHQLSISIDPLAVARGDWTVACGTETIQEKIRRKLRFDAIVAANDDMALGALAVLRAIHLRCPEDVSVVGFDDAPTARFSHPSLTTMSQPLARLGSAGVERLVAAWTGTTDASSTTLETELILRESCGCHPANQLSGPLRGRTQGNPRHSLTSEIRDLLRPIFDSNSQRDRWSSELVKATAAEVQGSAGSLARTLTSLILRIPGPHVPLYELQRIVTCLRDATMESVCSSEVEEAFHTARVLIGSHSYRREGEKHLKNEYLLAELRVSWERLATALSLGSLRRVLAYELPHFGIRSALVALFHRGDFSRLVPLVCVRDGVRSDLPEVPYPTSALAPSGVFNTSQRRSMTVLPLTFEAEYLGLAILELPQGLEVYTLLREQVGSAIKTATLHQEILAKERLHALAQEDKRVTAERLKSLNLIAGGVAHDLNNALGPLVALPETIQRDLAERFGDKVPSDVAEDLETIRQAGQRAALTIRDLLALGKPNETPQGAVDVGTFVKQEKPTLKALLEKDPQITLTIEPPAPGLVVLVSKPHLARVITNLVINAADAIVGKGTIAIRARRVLLDCALDGIERVEPGDYVVIEVEDSGSGIPKGHLSRILEPFFTAKQRPGSSGTGLGLAIVHRIVKEAGGHLYIESEVGRGTHFHIYLPYQRDVDCPKSASPAPIVGGKERILVVDDEPVQLRTARRILEQLGYEVTAASSGEEAIGLCQRAALAQPYDLVIMDMVMPGQWDGLATIEAIRNVTPAQRVLIASGYAPEQTDEKAAERGLPWLSKPYSRAKLANTVRETLSSLSVT